MFDAGIRHLAAMAYLRSTGSRLDIDEVYSPMFGPNALVERAAVTPTTTAGAGPLAGAGIGPRLRLCPRRL
jgi:hypothetical protein